MAIPMSTASKPESLFAGNATGSTLALAPLPSGPPSQRQPDLAGLRASRFAGARAHDVPVRRNSFLESTLTGANADTCGDSTCALGMFDGLGGIVDGEHLVGELRREYSQPLSVLARWIVDKRVVHFTRQATIFVPRFQFVASSPGVAMMRPAPAIRMTLEELGDLFDECERVEWFARPNYWLDGRAPAELALTHADRVAQAARSDRYITKGW